MLLRRGLSRIFFRRGCTRLLLYFNTNKPHSFFLHYTSCIRKPQVISGGWGVRTPCTLPLDPPLLRVVGSCCAKLETSQTFSYVQTDTTLLAYNSFARSFRRPRCRRRGRILRSLIRISLTHLYYTSVLRYHNLSSFSTSENKAAFPVLDDNVTQIYQLFNFQLN